jgi:Rrf2 family protein
LDKVLFPSGEERESRNSSLVPSSALLSLKVSGSQRASAVEEALVRPDAQTRRNNMNLLSRRSLLAIAAVVDIALHSRPSPVAAKALAARHKLPPRHLETLLQGLVHAKILKGVRGPRGGYELARERRRISVGEIVRTSVSLSTADPEDIGSRSKLLEKVIEPSVRKAGESFLANLDGITVEQLCEEAEKAQILAEEKVGGDFAI